MKQILFEGRFLVNVVSGVIRQDDLFLVRRQMNWERLYRLSDYHKVANIMQVGMMGGAGSMPPNWREKFFNRYQEALRYSDIFEKSETKILTTLNKKAISTLILESTALRKFYPIPETAGCNALRLYCDSTEHFVSAKGVLIDLGYVTDRFYPGFGEHMLSDDTGFQVELYYRLPFITKGYERCMKKLLQRAYPDPDFPNLKTFSIDCSYIFRMAEECYNFANNGLLVRYMLDTFQFYRALGKRMNMTDVHNWLKKFGVDEIADALLQLSGMWFAPRSSKEFHTPSEKLSLYEEIETRIFSNGMEGQNRIVQASVLHTQIRRANQQEERAEERVAFFERLHARFHKDPRKRAVTAGAVSSVRRAPEQEIRDIDAIGDVVVTSGKRGAILNTRLYSISVPELWMGRCAAVCRTFDENMDTAKFGKDKKYPNNYVLYLNFITEEKKQVPLMKFTMFMNIENAAKLQRGDVAAYYIGKLTHSEDGQKYPLHVMVEIMEDDNIGNRNKRAYKNMLDSSEDVLLSFKVPKEDRGGGLNRYEPFIDWQWGDMPKEYYYGM